MTDELHIQTATSDDSDDGGFTLVEKNALKYMGFDRTAVRIKVFEEAGWDIVEADFDTGVKGRNAGIDYALLRGAKREEDFVDGEWVVTHNCIWAVRQPLESK